MIQEALEFLAEIQTPKNPVTHEVGGVHYRVNVDGTIGTAIPKIDLRPKVAQFGVSTLTGFVQAVNALKIDGAAVHVITPALVQLVDAATDKEWGTRNLYISAQHENEIKFEFGKFYEPEAFLLAFRASFYFNENAVNIQKLCSTVTAGNAVSVADDGISQEVRTVAGTVSKVAVELPAEGIPLIPWRTFREANPVESKFLLRMRGVKDKLPEIALFEIDAKWKIDTIASVVRYLRKELGDAAIIIA